MLRVAGVLAAILMISCVLLLLPQPAQASTLTTTINVGNGVGGIAITPNGDYVYSTNRFDGTVSVISTLSNTVIDTITVGGNPIGVAIAPNGEYAYVANYYDDTVSVIATATNTVNATITGFDYPEGVAIAPNGELVYITNYFGNTVSVISTDNNTVTATITGLNYPESVAVTSNGEYVYVKNSYDGTSVSVISTDNNTVIETINIGGDYYYYDFEGGIGEIAVAPNGECIYVTNNDWSIGNSVSVINASTNTVTETIILGGMTDPEFGGSSGVAVAPNGECIYVTNNDWMSGYWLSVINTTTNTITENVSLGEMYDPFGGGCVAVTPNGEYVYAANGGYDSNSISVISVTSPLTYTITVTQNDNGQISPGTTTGDYGDTPTFTITPNTGYHIASITVNGESVAVDTSAGQSYQFSAVSADGSITATYAINTFSITVSQGDHGTISPETTTVNYGAGQGFTFTPAIGYHIVAVIVNGTTVGTTSPYTVSDVTGATSLTAEFAINTYAITVTHGANGLITGPRSVDYGTDAVYTVAPSTGYHIVDVVVDGVFKGATASYTISNVQATHTVTAIFAINTDVITATVTTTGDTYSIEISGNVTAQQMSNVTITPYQSNTTTIVSFTVTGPSGTSGFGNMTLPKTSIPYGTNPVVYIDNNQVLNQGFTQDADNYYVWYTTHFSTHEVTIQFTSTPSPTPTITPNPSTMSLNVPIIAAVILMGLVIFGLLVKRKSRPNHQVLS